MYNFCSWALNGVAPECRVVCLQQLGTPCEVPEIKHVYALHCSWCMKRIKIDSTTICFTLCWMINRSTRLCRLSQRPFPCKYDLLSRQRPLCFRVDRNCSYALLGLLRFASDLVKKRTSIYFAWARIPMFGLHSCHLILFWQIKLTTEINFRRINSLRDWLKGDEFIYWLNK